MEYTWNILRAMLNCSYKAWLLNKDSLLQNVSDPYNSEARKAFLPVSKVIPHDRIALTALYSQKLTDSMQVIYKASEEVPLKTTTIHFATYIVQATELLKNTEAVLLKEKPPVFYKNPHCPECQFRVTCYEKLKERDCISILANMPPKVLAKYHKKGITSITQLSHLFRPRRRRGKDYSVGNYLWELKALALREQKTYVVHPPELPNVPAMIYIDFEGELEKSFVYLLGGIIQVDGKPDEAFSFWANTKDDERSSAEKLFTLLKQYPDIPIYHYGSYELQTLRHWAKKWKATYKQELPQIEKRMVNLLSYLRSHVYPPTYGNGLKEVGRFLGFQWQYAEADGLLSLAWRKKWEETKDEQWKEKLVRYNNDDCRVLITVQSWFRQLATNADKDTVAQISEMKRQSPFKFQDNPHYGEDYMYISRAAYFDYQRKKIYWRNQKSLALPKHTSPPHIKKGIPVWKPHKVHEVVIAPLAKVCPRCGNKKLYRLQTRTSAYRQTDLKFTAFGIKQWVREYRTAQSKCKKCRMHFNNAVVRRLQYGDTLYAWALNLYVKYRVSHELICGMLLEYFGIWMNHVHFLERKHQWWKRWKPEVAYLWKIILNSPVIHIDETTVRLSKDKGYVWVFATPHTVFYHFSLSHEADFLLEWLKGYKGIIVTDFFPAYEAVPVKRQKCLIHLIRDLNDDLYKSPFDEEYKQLVHAFGKILRAIIQTIDRYGLKKTHLKKHIQDTEKFRLEFLDCEHTSELSIKYAKRLRKHWEHLWTFLKHDGVPWNNNNAETAVKAFAQYRRGVNGQVSENGIRDYLEMLGIAQTCRYRNISFLSFLRSKKGIWENVHPEALPDFLPFNQALLFTHSLAFERQIDWLQWKQSGNRPSFIPSNPDKTYRKSGWIDWHDWLGFSFLSFPNARTYVRKQGLKNRSAYIMWCRSGKRPKFIPSTPERVYHHTGWQGWKDYLHA